jgi:hypothetical protein
MTILELADVMFTVLAIGLAVYALLELGTYMEEIERVARSIRGLEFQVNEQLATLKRRVDRLMRSALGED